MFYKQKDTDKKMPFSERSWTDLMVLAVRRQINICIHYTHYHPHPDHLTV